MSLLDDQEGSGTVVDKQFQRFIETESQKQQFQEYAHGLTGICWDICVDRPSPRLDSKTQNCLVNCVQRFIDTTTLVTSRLERVVSENLSMLQS